MPTGAHLVKYKQDDYATIRDMYARGITQVRIAAYVGCSQQLVSDVLHNRVAGARSSFKTTPPDAQR